MMKIAVPLGTDTCSKMVYDLPVENAVCYVKGEFKDNFLSTMCKLYYLKKDAVFVYTDKVDVELIELEKACEGICINDESLESNIKDCVRAINKAKEDNTCYDYSRMLIVSNLSKELDRVREDSKYMENLITVLTEGPRYGINLFCIEYGNVPLCCTRCNLTLFYGEYNGRKLPDGVVAVKQQNIIADVKYFNKVNLLGKGSAIVGDNDN